MTPKVSFMLTVGHQSTLHSYSNTSQRFTKPTINSLKHTRKSSKVYNKSHFIKKGLIIQNWSFQQLDIYIHAQLNIGGSGVVNPKNDNIIISK